MFRAVAQVWVSLAIAPNQSQLKEDWIGKLEMLQHDAIRRVRLLLS
jgi:hypothetical protein